MVDVLAVVGAVGGIVGGAGAVWAAIVAQRARGTSAMSADAAADSAASARGALKIMEEDAARKVELTNVVWDVTVSAGRIIVRNVGTTTAYGAEVTLTIDRGFPSLRDVVERIGPLGPQDVGPEQAFEHVAVAGIDGLVATIAADAQITWRSALEVPDRATITAKG